MGNLSHCLFWQSSLWDFSLYHYSNLVHSYHFLFQPFSILLCWHTTKLGVGKLPHYRERWPWKLYFLSLLLKTQVTENPSLSLLWKMYTGHGSPLPICKFPSSFKYRNFDLHGVIIILIFLCTWWYMLSLTIQLVTDYILFWWFFGCTLLYWIWTAWKKWDMKPSSIVSLFSPDSSFICFPHSSIIKYTLKNNFLCK